METELYKIRSLSSCMKAAYDMYISNIKTVFRRTWVPALLFAALMAVAVVLFYDTIVFLQTPTFANMSGIGLAAIFWLLAVASSVWFYAIIISLLDGASMKANLPRVVRLTLLLFAIAVVFTIISSLASLVPLFGATPQSNASYDFALSTVIGVAVYFCFAVVSVPLIYSSMKYLMEPKLKLISVLGKSYKTGWRHWGYLFMLCLLAGIIFSVIGLVVNLPATISSMAFVINAGGLLLGDVSGLPGLFGVMAWLVSFISSFIMIYVVAWFVIICYYAYGHIEAKEQAKKEQNEMVQASATQVEPDFEEIK